MAQLKQACTVTNGSQTVTVIGTNVAYRIKANSIFMVQGELVPYVVAADAVYDGTNTVVTLAASYQGVSAAMTNGVFATDFTVPDNLPLISQGDVGTAAIWTNAMYKIQALMTAVSPSGLVASVNDIHASLNGAQQSQAAAAASAAAALASQNAAKTSETNSKTSETNAKTSETNSKTSETNSASSKTAAAGSASAASTSASAASSSQGAAATSATSAANSASASAGSASAASTSQGAALASQNAAKTSETNAKTSETNAKTSETNAKTSETNAAGSATAAAGSASAALASQNAAKTSETNAGSSLSQVQGILATLNALQLGSKASDPTKDNNGNALTVGSKYFNTTTQQTRVYTSTGWQDEDQTSETMAANATASASAAAGSASAASGSATAASNSQTAAHTSETNAANSAAAALASQNAAKTSETNAKTSESNAKTSETNSKTSETNAAASAASAAQTAANLGNPVAKAGDTMTGDLLLDNAKVQSTRYGTGGAIVLRSAAGTSAAPTALTSGNSAGTAVFRGYDGANYQDVASVDGVVDANITSSSSSGYLSLSTTPAGSVSKAERMRITSRGRVLIGTTTDDGNNLMQVNGNARVFGSLSAQATGTAGAWVSSDAAHGYFQSNGDTVVGSIAGNTIFTANNAEKARITSAGRVLIGTTTDDGANLLQVAGNVAVTGNQTLTNTTNNTVGSISSGAYVQGLSIEAFNVGNTVKKNLALAPWGGRILMGTVIDNGSSLLQVNGEINQTNASHVIQTYGVYQSYRVRSAAGTSSAPAATTSGTQLGGLNLAGYTGSSYLDVATISAWAEEAYTTSTTATSLRFYTTPTGSTAQAERMRMTGSGRVLIGTTTDDGINLLQVNGTIEGSSASGALRASNGSGTGQTSIFMKREGAIADQKTWEFLHGSDGGFTLRSVNDAYSASSNAIWVGRGTGMNVGTMALMQSGGRVLIGTTTDDGANLLQVAGAMKATGYVTGAGMTVNPLTDGTAPIAFQNAAGKWRWTIWKDNAAESGSNAGSNLNINALADDGTTQTNVLSINRASSAVTVNGQILAKEGTVSAPGYSFQNDGAPDTGFFHIADGTFAITNNAKETARFISGSTNRMLLGTSTDDGSNVLQIAGNARTYGSHVAGASGTATSWISADTNAGYFQTNGNAVVGSAGASGILILTAGNVEKARILQSGRVLIGTTTDDGASLLQVNGAVNILGNKLTINRASGEGDLMLGQNDGYFYGNTATAGWWSPTKGTWNYDFTQRNLTVNTYPVWHSGNFTPGNYAPLAGATFTGNITLNTASTTWRSVIFQAAGKTRWDISTSADTDTGSNVGENFYIRRFNDDGSWNSDVLQVPRNTGVANFPIRPTFNGATPWDSGNFNPANYVTTSGLAYTSSHLRTAGGTDTTWNWSGQGGTPAWLWGGSDGANMYVYNPANFSVSYANSSNYADHCDHIVQGGNNITMQWDGSASHVNFIVNGQGVAYIAYNWSDVRFKTNIRASKEDSLALVEQIDFKEFDFKDGSRHMEAGFIAQDVEKFAPQWIGKKPAVIDGEEVDDARYFDDQAMLFSALRAIQQLSAEVKMLKAQLSTH
ncbi:tail fiber domain-containing protein [Paraburkholderia sp. RCC_158]|uniref:tail fiber domain-containing protein n=1 Tax=Paraburkholderia sp. RCC_158 TaxID=3239220 RepID=UPI003525DBF6